MKMQSKTCLLRFDDQALQRLAQRCGGLLRLRASYGNLLLGLDGRRARGHVVDRAALTKEGGEGSAAGATLARQRRAECTPVRATRTGSWPRCSEARAGKRGCVRAGGA